MLCDVNDHENQSQHYLDHQYLCLELSGRIIMLVGFSYHTGRKRRHFMGYIQVVALTHHQCTARGVQYSNSKGFAFDVGPSRFKPHPRTNFIKFSFYAPWGSVRVRL